MVISTFQLPQPGDDYDRLTRAFYFLAAYLFVSGGLIDSFALVVILQKVEDVTHMRIPAGKIRAKDMDTVKLMLETAERVGKPRK